MLLIATPGADMALISRAAMRRGQFGAFCAMIGINCASVLWTILAAAGFVAAVNAIPFATSVLLIIGALFMGYVGILDLKSGFAARKIHTENGNQDIGNETNFQLFQKGFFVNVTNPKIGLYYATVLPNFLTSESNQGAYIIAMGATHNILGFLWFMSFAFFLIKGTNFFGTPKAKANVTIFTGFALITFCVLALGFAFSDMTS